MGQQISYLTVIVVHSTMQLMHHNHCQITTIYVCTSCIASCTLLDWSARLIPPLLFYMLRFILCEGEGSSNSCYIPCVHVWLYTMTYPNVGWYGCRYVNRDAVVHVLNYIYMYKSLQLTSWSIEPTIASYVR